MQILVDYLLEKVKKSKRHAACRVLKNYEHLDRDIGRFVHYTADTLVSAFRRVSSRTNKEVGEANLTATAVTIGEYILNYSGNPKEPDEAPWDWFDRRVSMGALFIEAFYQNQWVNIGKMYRDIKNKDKPAEFVPFQDLKFNQKKSDTPYIISIQDWPEEIEGEEDDPLYGISLSLIPSISGVIQKETERPVIKGWTEADNIKFGQYIYRDWVQAMNILQQTGWRINNEVHNIIAKNRSKILDQHKQFPLKYRSKTIEFDRTMAKAELVRNKDFYYYMECDYRGRLYYTAPFLNFQSNDIARGQLLFAEKKEMTDEGRYWLAIHTACSYNETYSIDDLPEWLTTDYRPHLEAEELLDISVDKMTLDDRAAWTMHNMDWILELWETQTIRHEAEKPIAFLSCCQEWSLMFEAHDRGEEYMSALPIPVDGSNNGWQHLSAMSKDAHAGALVGVVPQEIQKDFYVQTAKELVKLMPEWFSERQMPMKHIRKGIAKRGSMTRAYSAGALKIAENMYLDCHVEGYTRKYNITEEDCVELAKNLVKAIDTVCAGPLQTMKFLQKIAEQEIGSQTAIDKHRKTMEWTTPSGFPVSYGAFADFDISSHPTFATDQRPEEIQNSRGEDSFRIHLRGKEPTDKPKIRSFMSGISPNFVHSMDAAHMSLVIKEWNGSFGPVHDSFSVHASDVPDLLDIIKKQFVRMYSYSNFFDEIQRMLLSEPEDFIYSQPEIGTLEIREVQDSEYFFA